MSDADARDAYVTTRSLATGHPVVDASDRLVLDAMADYYEEVLAYLATRASGDPLARSPYSQEARQLARQFGPGGTWSNEDVEMAFTFSMLSMSFSFQFLAGLRALLRSGDVIISPAPLTRAAMENCARVWWLLDPRLHAPGGIRKRSARVFLANLDDLTRQKTVALAADLPTAPRMGAAVKEWRTQELKSRFYPSEIVDASGRLTICGERLPGFSDSMKVLEEAGKSDSASLAYDVLSNASHPTPHVLASMLTRHDETPGAWQLHLPDATYPYRLARAAVIHHLNASILIDQYKGAEHNDLDALRRRIDTLPTP